MVYDSPISKTSRGIFVVFQTCDPGLGERPVYFNKMNSQEKELSVLETIYNNESQMSQRSLASRTGLSLGMTNVILKRLAGKGLVTIKKVNSRNIRYAVTPQGIEEISRRSYNYFKRTISHVVSYKETLESLVKEIVRRGYLQIALVGKSDLDFIIEHLCYKHDVIFLIGLDEADEMTFLLYGEGHSKNKADGENDETRNAVFLQELLIS